MKIKENSLIFERYIKSILNEDLQKAHSKRYDVIFEVGGEYKLPDGNNYIVNRITEIPTTIHFTITTGPNNGRQSSFELEKAAKYHKEQISTNEYKLSTMELQNKNYFYLMGIISRHGYIVINTPEQYKDDVEKQYMHATGKDLKEELKGSYQIIENGKKWHPSLNIVLPGKFKNLIERLNIPGIEIKNGSAGNLIINNTRFVWTLIKIYKFEAGRNNTNIERILEAIPQEYKSEFLKNDSA